MSKFVIGPDAALALIDESVQVAAGHQLFAPTLVRSQLLSLLYQQVRRADLTKREAQHRLDRLRALKIRLLGDRVLLDTAWKIADQLGWPDTFHAEYVALTQLQADALVTADANLAAAGTLVAILPLSALAVPPA